MRTVRPDCEFGEHSWCRIGEVRTVYGDLIRPARRCDCSCHKELKRRQWVEDLPWVQLPDHWQG